MADDLDWEEWDAQTSPLSFGHHCLAGSFAGVVSWATTHSFCCCGVAWHGAVLSAKSGVCAGNNLV
eukprot:scaffold281727_cov122-Cyclotella_meneghiniana.AAC.3